MKTKLVSIILPTYNEAENILDLIKEIDRVVTNKKEIIIVDDNSLDGTSRLVLGFKKTHPSFPIFIKTRTKNPGLTNSIKDGIRLAKGVVICWMDADFSMPPKVIPKLLKKINEGFDIAVGSRYIPGGKIKISQLSNDPILKIHLSRALNLFARFILGGWFRDYTSGFVVAKKSVLRKIVLHGDYGEYMIDFIIRSKRANFKIVEVPYAAKLREKGYSKTGQNAWGYIKRGRKYVTTILKLKILN